MLRNAATIGILGTIGALINRLGVIFLTISTGALGYVVLTTLHGKDGDEGTDTGTGDGDADDATISSPWACVFIFVMMGYLGYYVCLRNVFAMSVDTSTCLEYDVYAVWVLVIY